MSVISEDMGECINNKQKQKNLGLSLDSQGLAPVLDEFLLGQEKTTDMLAVHC